MIINNDLKFIYIHVPKTGGASLQQKLKLIPGTSISRPPHGSIKDYYKPGYYTFATIRNPFKWYVSMYSFKGSTWLHELYDGKDKTFKTWLKGVLELNPKKEDIIKTINKCADEDSLDYKFHLKLVQENKIDNMGWLSHLFMFSCYRNYDKLIEQNDITLIGKSDIDVFIQTEQLNQIHEYIDDPTLKEKLTKNAQPIHINKSEHNKYQEYYDDELKQLVLEKDKFLFNKFNYEF